MYNWALSAALWIIPIMFNVSFALLAKQFEYPDILRQPTEYVLAKFSAGGTPLILTWWVFMLSAVLFAPISVSLAWYFPQHHVWLHQLAALFGTLAAIMQFIGLVRWPFLIPFLARESAQADPAKTMMIDIIFQSSNRLLGVAIGEHLGYIFTGVWSLTIGLILLSATGYASILGMIGLLLGCALVICSLEFVGKHEKSGWHFAGQITPIVYIIWSIWLMALGVYVAIS